MQTKIYFTFFFRKVYYLLISPVSLRYAKISRSIVCFELWSRNKMVKLCRSLMYRSIFSYWGWFMYIPRKIYSFCRVPVRFLSLFHFLWTLQKNPVISPDFLVWKFCEKEQFPHSFPFCSDIDYYAIWHWKFFSTTSIWEDKLL